MMSLPCCELDPFVCLPFPWYNWNQYGGHGGTWVWPREKSLKRKRAWLAY